MPAAASNSTTSDASAIGEERPGKAFRLFRLIDIGLLSGLVAGLVVAIGARLAMWIVAVSDPDAASTLDQARGFTGETLFVLFTITVAGAPLGLAFVAAARWLPGRWFGKGIAFGGLLLLLVGLPIMLIEKEYSAGPPQLARALIAALLMSYGIVAAGTNEWLARRWPATSPRRVAPIAGFLLLLIPGLPGLLVGMFILGWH